VIRVLLVKTVEAVFWKQILILYAPKFASPSKNLNPIINITTIFNNNNNNKIHPRASPVLPTALATVFATQTLELVSVTQDFLPPYATLVPRDTPTTPNATNPFFARTIVLETETVIAAPGSAAASPDIKAYPVIPVLKVVLPFFFSRNSSFFD